MFNHDPAHTGYNPEESALQPPLKVKWTFVAAGAVYTPTVSSGTLYVGSDDGKVYALDAANGTLRWSYTMGGWRSSSPAVANGVVYVGSHDNKVYALDAATGALRWKDTTGEAYSSPAVVNGVVYVASRDQKVYALDAATGALRWSYTTGGVVFSSPAVANGVVYVASRDRKVYALNAATGTLRWSYTTGAAVYASPAVANGVVYVGSDDGKVYAFESQPPPVFMQPLPVYQTTSVSFPISWTVPVTWTGTAAGSYDAQYRDGPSASWTDLITATTALSTTFTGAQDGRPYSFRARATTVTGAVGDWSDVVSTTVDLTPPTGSLAVQGWASSLQAMSITLAPSATDATSGVYQMQLSTDGVTYSDWEPYAATRAYTLPAGASTVYARFKDNAGNISQPVSATVDLDNASPTGSVNINSGAAYANTVTATLALSATDGLSGVSEMAFSNDGSAWSQWDTFAASKPWPLASGPDGPRTAYARFRDAAGHVSPVYSDSILLDTTPPGTPQPDDGVSGLGNNPRPTFRWPEVADNLSGLEGYYYKVDGGPEFLVVGTAVTLATQADGSHTFYLRARDRAGNYSPYGSHAFSIKTNLPQTPGVIQPQTPTAFDRTVVSGLSEQGLSIKLYANGSFVGQTTAGSYGVWNFVNVPLALGANVLYATATDAAGNTSLLSTPAVVDRVEVWAPPPAPQASAVISTTGGTVAAGNNVSVTVPAGAFAEEVNLTLTPYAPVSAPGVFGVVSANAYTSITAVATSSGAKVTTFQQPITITIAYNPAALGGVPESSLQVSYYDEATKQWVALPSVVDTVNHTVSAQTTHFSVYDAQVSLLTNRVYLPLVVGTVSGW